MWIKVRDFLVEMLLKYGIKGLVEAYNKYGQDGVDKFLEKYWDKLDTLLEKYVGKENANLILGCIRDFFAEQVKDVDKEIAD